MDHGNRFHRPKRRWLLHWIACEVVGEYRAGKGSLGDLTEQALTRRWNIPSVVTNEYGKTMVFMFTDQGIRPEEAGLFRAMVAERRLDESATPEELAERARARLAGKGTNLAG